MAFELSLKHITRTTLFLLISYYTYIEIMCILWVLWVPTFVPGLRNSIIIELGIGFNIAFSNSIGIGIEIGIAKKSRPVLLLVLVLQFTLSQYWYWYCYWKTHSLSIGIGIVIAKHLQQLLSLLLELFINFSSIDVKMASEITLFLDNTVIYKCKITKKGIRKLWKWWQ